jgi:glutaredoxin-related protein
MEYIEELKTGKQIEIIKAYKQDLENVSISYSIDGEERFFSTRNDYEAYKEVRDNFGANQTKTVQDSQQEFINVTQEQIKEICRLMYEAGEAIWLKKEMMLIEIKEAEEIAQIKSIAWGDTNV